MDTTRARNVLGWQSRCTATEAVQAAPQGMRDGDGLPTAHGWVVPWADQWAGRLKWRRERPCWPPGGGFVAEFFTKAQAFNTFTLPIAHGLLRRRIAARRAETKNGLSGPGVPTARRVPTEQVRRTSVGMAARPAAGATVPVGSKTQHVVVSRRVCEVSVLRSKAGLGPLPPRGFDSMSALPSQQASDSARPRGRA